jgi:GT2 family glycosyltransferase
MTRRLDVVVVAYNAADELGCCLGALGNDVKTTVVDNSSSAAVRVVAEGRGAEYIDPGTNLGFAAAVNVALRQLTGESPRDVLLLNPDAALAPDKLKTLAAYLHAPANHDVAAVAPVLVGADNAEQRVMWPFPSPARAWAEAFGFGRFPARHTFAIGAILLLRWEAVRQVGLFDERFFLYAEEADWQRRALALGWKSALCQDAVAVHLGAGTSGDRSTREALFHAAHETYIRKWYGRAGWWTFRCAACLGAAARAVVLRRERRAEAARRALLYLRGPRRCTAIIRDS